MKSVKYVTGVCRLSYAHVFKPFTNFSGATQYSAALLIPKTSADVQRYQEAAKKLLADPDVRQILGRGATLETLDIGLRDGNLRDQEEYKDMYYINAKANTEYPPKVYNYDRTEVVEPEEVYSGCYVQAILRLYAYNKGGRKGIGVGLSAIRKCKDGDPFVDSWSVNDFDDRLVESQLNELM